ncbi:hypothetical protein ACFCP7_27385 [Paenibacillus elgii]
MNFPRKRSNFAILLVVAMLLHMAGVLYVAPEPAHAAGTTYYVDSVGGNDTNAWSPKTIQAVGFVM